MARRTHVQLEKRFADVAHRLNVQVGHEPGCIALDHVPGGGYRIVVMCENGGYSTSTFGNVTLPASAMYDALELILYATSFAAKRT